MPTSCRWGILGTANIARKNWQALRLAGNAELVAVASRSTERSQQFISECSATVPWPTLPRALGSYADLIAAPDVDAIYIPLPTGLRTEWAVKAAEAGKHIVVEKPVGVTTAEVDRILAACKAHNVQFMDGVMFMHSRRLEALRKTLDDGTSIGRIRRIASQFSFQGPAEFRQQNIRVSSDLEPLGCLGDLGWYTIRFSLWVMQGELPQRVSGRLLDESGRPDSPGRVPMEFSAELFFADGVSASFYNSFQTENQQWASVSGEKGHLLLRDFVLPYFDSEVSYSVTQAAFHVSGCQFNMEDHTRTVAVPEYSNNAENAQETNLFRTFSDLVLTGRRDNYWLEIARKTQLVMDLCLQSARNEGRMLDVPR